MYRVRGKIEQTSVEEMRGHWMRKPYTSKIIDHFYTDYQPQSSPLGNRETLLSGIEALKTRYPSEADVPFPDNARGIAIKANYIEVWHGSAADRLHERCLYSLNDGVWNREILVP